MYIHIGYYPVEFNIVNNETLKQIAIGAKFYWNKLIRVRLRQSSTLMDDYQQRAVYLVCKTKKEMTLFRLLFCIMKAESS